jgi:hypothetical protein
MLADEFISVIKNDLKIGDEEDENTAVEDFEEADD